VSRRLGLRLVLGPAAPYALLRVATGSQPANDPCGTLYTNPSLTSLYSIPPLPSAVAFFFAMEEFPPEEFKAVLDKSKVVSAGLIKMPSGVERRQDVESGRYFWADHVFRTVSEAPPERCFQAQAACCGNT